MDPKYQELLEAIENHKTIQGALMPVMHKAQEIFGCLDEDVQEFISKNMDVPVSKIYGVATFYTQFTLEPKGKYTVGVCLGTACYVRGSQKVFDKFIEELGVEAGGTTPDKLFTLDATRCIGCCGLAPALMVNDEVYGRLTADDVSGIVAKYKAKG